MLHKEPGALVFWLVLTPHHFGGFGVFFQLGRKGFVREGVQLLDANQRCIVRAQLVALLDQVVIDLARAHQQALDLLGVFDDAFFLLGNHGLEAAVGKGFDR